MHIEILGLDCILVTTGKAAKYQIFMLSTILYMICIQMHMYMVYMYVCTVYMCTRMLSLSCLFFSSIVVHDE